MKNILLIFLLFSLPSISYWNNFTKIISNDITLEFVTYDVWTDMFDIKVWLSQTAEPLSTISQQYWAISGINWVFFCPADYSECWGKNYTINERFSSGEDLSFYLDTGERAVFWWDRDSLPFLHQTAKINPNKRDGIFEWLGNFPILYSNWVSMLEHYHDVWLYDRKMSVYLPRHFICSNQGKTKIFFGRSSATSLDNLAPALFDVWCWDGINLDAWASSHFNYNGRELEVWSRKVLDWFFIVPKTFDAQEINAKLNSAMPEITRILKRYPKTSALERINTVREYIKTYRWNIYEEYSQDIYDSEWKINGYTLNITDSQELEKIYLFNLLDKELKNIYREISRY